jgi:hypothetical protein
MMVLLLVLVLVVIKHLPKTRVFPRGCSLKAALQRVGRQRHDPVEYSCTHTVKHAAHTP